MVFSRLSKLFFLLGASIVLAFAMLAFPLPRRAQAQTGSTPQAQGSGQGKIEGQLVEGTKGASLSNTEGLTVTLHMAATGATSTVTQTTKMDADGRFSFSNLDTISTTRYLAIASYQEVPYYSDILSFDANQTTLPISMTVYETTTDPAAIHVSQTHLVFDVQTREFNVLQVVAIQNTSDRTYIGSTASGPHRITLQLPFLQGASTIEFDNPAATDSTLRGSEFLAYALPIPPGDDQIVYNYTLPFEPPTYGLNLKMPYDVDKLRVLLADVGATIQSTQLSAPSNFPTQSGMQFIVSSADNIKAGTVVSAAFNNLPTTVGSATPETNPATVPAATANNNLQIIGGVVLGIATLAAVALLAYPIIRRRRALAAEEEEPVAGSGRRIELLQAMADLDDEFEAQKITEAEYRERRAQLKAELLELTPGNRPAGKGGE